METISHLAASADWKAKMYRWINLTHTVHIMNEAEACSQIKQELYMLASALTT